MMTKSNKKNFMSNEVNNKIDLELQAVVWDMFELLKEKRQEKMDVIQRFDIFKLGEHLILKNRRHNPMLKDKLVMKKKSLSINSITVLIIGGTDKQVMLLPTEYKKERRSEIEV